MAEYINTIKEFKRMCKYYNGACKPAYVDCPLYEWGKGCNISHCRLIAFDQPEHFVGTVVRWADEHPEPVYPEWYTWLASMDVVPEKVPRDVASMLADIGLLRQIPAHTAQRLGIEPKVVG